MTILVIAEHTAATLRPATRSALGFAAGLAEQLDCDLRTLVLGHGVQQVAEQAAAFSSVWLADDEVLAAPLADRYAKVIADLVLANQVTHVVAASTTFSKDIVSRAAGLLGGAMASDVLGHELIGGELHLRRPMFAGALTATITLNGHPQIITIQPSAYSPPPPQATLSPIERLAVDAGSLPDGIHYEGLDSKASHRPDVTEARIVCSGGRAIRSAEDYEQLVGRLADQLGGAAGSSRALVDAGITPNELQVGQTGKVVAPELYLALGISGAVQHLAGMKNSKTVVAINTDPEAPIFEVADYGLVGDVYELVPELIERLAAKRSGEGPAKPE